MADKILVTGPFGQVGTELVPQLQRRYGVENVIVVGHSKVPEQFEGVVQRTDICDISALRAIFIKHSVTQVYHLAALLSVTGEQNPNKAWEVNLVAVKNLFDLCVELKVQKVFWASSMAVFGPTTPKENTPQHTSIEPTTMYGITKYTGQLLGQYYYNRYGLDVRSLRYPGIISWKELPGGGTTDYAIGIFYGALTTGKYECFVSAETRLPMIYMDDAIKATLDIMDAPAESIRERTSYNLAAISFSVAELAAEISKHCPLEVEYSRIIGRRSQIHGRIPSMTLLRGRIGAGSIKLDWENFQNPSWGNDRSLEIVMHSLNYKNIDTADQHITITSRLQSTSLFIIIDTPSEILTAIFKQEQATPYQQFFQEPLGALYSQISKYPQSRLREIVGLKDNFMSICVAQLEKTDRKAYIRSLIQSVPNDRQLQSEKNLSRRMQDIEANRLNDLARLERVERKVQEQQAKYIALQKYVDSKMEELNMKIAALSSKWEEEANPQV